MNTDEKCQWLHETVSTRPLVNYPFNLDSLPRNGIYFFYENGELWGHDNDDPRMVRIGTHRQNNFRSRIKDHYLIDERKYDMRRGKPAPKDRSIFRKNIGRVIVNRDHPEYLTIWDIDFMTRKKRDGYAHLRDIDLEINIERQITEILRKHFSFRYIEIQDQEQRMGRMGLESNLIATVAQCSSCRPSKDWFGLSSPIMKIRDSGLWLVQHIDDDPINEMDMARVADGCTERV